METCVKCKKNDDINTIFPYKTCNKLLCSTCGELTASEVKCLQLKSKRKLKYYCEAFEEGLSKVPILIKEVAELRECINPIINRSSTTNTGSSTCNYTTNHDMEMTVAEVMERQGRASNIIIYNVNKSVKPTQAERNSEDREAVKCILKGISIDKSNLTFFRLVKNSFNKARPIKAPRDYFRKIKAELDRIVADGGNTKTIRFINNVPTIMSKDSAHSTKN
nr:unnamed protein product [Callosobruchus analis]